MELKDKVAIVTGGASGIGESTVKLFAAQGAKVVIADVNEEAGNKLAEAVKANGGEAIFVKSDTSVPGDSEKVVNAAISAFGKLDIAVNNAGIGGPAAPVGEYDIEAWNKVIAINLSGVFYGMRYQIPAMLKNGSGSIINMASILGSVGFAQSGAYVAAKHGVVGLTKNGALEYTKLGIRVNAIGPGFIKTPLLDENLDEATMEFLKTLHPIGRLGTPDEVAELALWLASDKASFVSGSYYTVDGGYVAQ